MHSVGAWLLDGEVTGHITHYEGAEFLAAGGVGVCPAMMRCYAQSVIIRLYRHGVNACAY